MWGRIVGALALCLLLAFPASAATVQPISDCSGTITLGGSAQALVAANAAKNYLMIQNVGVANLGVSLTNPPVIGAAGTLTLGPGASFVFESNFFNTSALYIIGPNTAQPYTCWRR